MKDQMGAIIPQRALRPHGSRDPGKETGNRQPYATGLAQFLTKNQVIKPINRVN